MVRTEVLQRQHSQHDPVFRSGLAGRQLHHRKQEAIAAARMGLDVLCFAGALAESGADLADAIIQPLFVIDEGFPSPDVLADLIPGDDLSGTGNQESKHLERLNLELNCRAVLAQLAASDVQLELRKSKSDGRIRNSAHLEPPGAMPDIIRASAKTHARLIPDPLFLYQPRLRIISVRKPESGGDRCERDS